MGGQTALAAGWMARAAELTRREAALDEGVLSLSLPHSRLYGESL